MNSDFSDIATALTASVATDGQTTITGQLKFPSGTASAPSHTFSAELTTGMYLAGTGVLGFSADETSLLLLDSTRVGTGQDGAFLQFGNGAIPCPVGVVQDYAGSSAPAGWFLCYGSALSTTGYPELFSVIGYTYGGAGATFNLPDLRGRGTYGKLNMGGSSASAATRIDSTTYGADPTVLGTAGGGKSQTIAQANLPSVSFTVSGITISDTRAWATSNSLYPAVGSGGPGGFVAGTIVGAAATQAVTVSNGGTLSITSQGSAASGGSGTALSTISPGMIFNKIIFAGRA